MDSLSHKERVLKSLRFEEPDRVPLDIGGTNVTSFHIEIEKKLKEYFGFKDDKIMLNSHKMQSVIPDERILKYFNVDTRCISLHESEPWRKNSDGTFTDEWGIKYKKSSNGYYYEFVSHPLSNATVRDLENYHWPDPKSKRRIEGLKEKAKNFYKEYCIILEGLHEPIFGLASWLLGYEQFYIDLVTNKELIKKLFDGLLIFWKQLLEFVLGEIGDYIDIVKIADDLGAQNDLLISPKIYRELVKPRQAELFSFIKEKCDCKILFHCDGAIRKIIPDFIEIGVDILNPIQPGLPGMDAKSLKEKFENKLAFWGGGVDTQSTLSFGTPEDVKNEVKKYLNIFKPGGGYVFSQVHNIQPEVPIENIIAMYDTFFEYANY